MNLEVLDAFTWSFSLFESIFLRAVHEDYIECILLFTLFIASWMSHIINNRPAFRQGAGDGIVCGFLSVPSVLAAIDSSLLYPTVSLNLSLAIIFILSKALVPTTDFKFSLTIPFLVTALFSYVTQEDIIMMLCAVFFGIFVITCLMKYAPGSFSIGEFVMVSSLSSLPIRAIFDSSDDIERFCAIFIVFGVLCLALALLIKRPVIVLVVIFAVILSFNEIKEVIKFVLNMQRILLLVYCAAVCLIFILISAFWKGLSKFPQIIQRKFFHLMALFVFVPPVIIDSQFLRLCISGAIFVFLFIESLRITRFPYLAKIVENYVADFIDERDSNELILTHLFLLLGLGLPVLLTDDEVCGYLSIHVCGISVLAVGDAAASIFGVYYGKHKWPGSKKSYEGTAGAFIGTWVTLSIINIIGNAGINIKEIMCLIIPSLVGAFDEAFTSQIDNLTLPFVMIPSIVCSFYMIT